MYIFFDDKNSIQSTNSLIFYRNPYVDNLILAQNQMK